MESISSIVTFGYYTVKLYCTGNKSTASSYLSKDLRLQAEVVTAGQTLKGHHAGERMLSAPRRSYRTLFIPRYTVIANGNGEFQSEDLWFKGNFSDGKFDDITQNAVCNIRDTNTGQMQKYQGCFKGGQRHGYGELYLYSTEHAGHYLYYKGLWKEDRPHIGKLFNFAGVPIGQLSEGIFGPPGSPNPSPATSPRQIPATSQTFFKRKKVHCENDSDPPRPSPAPSPRPSPAPSPRPSPAPPPRPSPTSQEHGGASSLPNSGGGTPPLPQPHRAPQADPLPGPLDPSHLPSDPGNHPLIKKRFEIPPETPFLPFEESIELLTVCITYGKRKEELLRGKDALIFIGNTGAGKSTLANYVAGCKIAMKRAKEVGLSGIGKVAVVIPPEEGGPLAEVMRIGHAQMAQTFIPGVAEANGMVLVDCPGFLDNRGPEINIANAVNIRRLITAASSLKFVILINFHSLKADRARGLRDLITICTDLFGSEQTLRENMHSLLLGVTNVGQDIFLDDLRDFLMESTSDIVKLFVERLFVYDPEDQGGVNGAWDRPKLLQQIESMPGISGRYTQAFQTVMVDSDLQYLQRVGDDQVDRVDPLLEQGIYREVGVQLARLKDLSIIDHPAIKRALDRVEFTVVRHGFKLQDTAREKGALDNFDDAEAALDALKQMQKALCSLLDDKSQVDVDGLREFLEARRAKAQWHREQAAQLERLRGEVARLNELVRQLEDARAEAVEQKRQFEAWMADLTRKQEEARAVHERIVEDLRREMQDALARKDKEVAIAQQVEDEKAAAERRREQEVLEQAYRARLEVLEEERRRLEREQAEERERRERVQREQEQEAQRKIEELQKSKVAAEQAAREREEAKVAAEQAAREREERREQELKKAKEAAEAAAAAAEQAAAEQSAVTPEVFHKHCEEGQAAEVAAALEAARGDPRRLRALLEHRDGTWTPLHSAAGDGHGEVVRLLLEAGADRDARSEVGRTPMHSAAWKGHGEVVRLLLEAGADRDARDNDGRSPMHLAANYGRGEVLRLLLEAGADRDARDNNGWTPMHLAAGDGHGEVVRLLLEAGADRDARDNRGETPMHAAANYGRGEVLRLLLEAGADRDARDNDGWTPMHLAALQGHREVVRLLLVAGADRDARDKWGQTPMHRAQNPYPFANKDGCAAIIEMLS